MLQLLQFEFFCKPYEVFRKQFDELLYDFHENGVTDTKNSIFMIGKELESVKEKIKLQEIIHKKDKKNKKRSE